VLTVLKRFSLALWVLGKYSLHTVKVIGDRYLLFDSGMTNHAAVLKPVEILLDFFCVLSPSYYGPWGGGTFKLQFQQKLMLYALERQPRL
jgi:hypothetical protein